MFEHLDTRHGIQTGLATRVADAMDAAWQQIADFRHAKIDAATAASRASLSRAYGVPRDAHASELRREVMQDRSCLADQNVLTAGGACSP